MVRFLIDFVPGTEPAAGEYMFVSILTLILSLPWFYFCFLYIMRALGLYRIAKRRNVRHPWLAWFPCGRDWLLGAIGDHYRYTAKGKRQYIRWLLLLLSVISETALFLSEGFSFVFPFLFMDPELNAQMIHSLTDPPLRDHLILIIRASPYLLAALLILRLFPTWQIYQSAMPRRRISLLILNILVPFSPAVTIFAVRDYDQGMPPMHASAVDTLNEDQAQT